MASTSTAHDKDKQFTYDLVDVKIDEKDKKVSCKLKIPSRLPPRYDSKDLGEDPALLLVLQCKSDDGLRCFQIMKEVIHPNILHARAINVTKTQLLLWVDPYTNNSNLLAYLKKSMGVNYQRSPAVVVLPTKILRNIVSQILDGLNYLRLKGYYHGNFTMESTYYLMIEREIFVKLTNFKEKGAQKSVSLCQCEDLNDLGTGLTELSNIADELNIKNNTGQRLDFTYLVDLADKLKAVNEENLSKTYEKIKKHPFFWVIHERKKFFVYRVAMKMKTAEFRFAVDNCVDLCSLTWDTDDHDGFLPKMNQYRANRGLRAYNRASRCDFVRFIVALYTHEYEPFLLAHGKKVDETVTAIHPHIVLVLSNLLDSDEDWM